MSVFDSSALLAFLQGERGADVVETALQAGGLCGAANWSEVAQKVLSHGRNWHLARALLISFDLHVEPVTADDAEWAARRWRSGEGLALADRLRALSPRLVLERGYALVCTSEGTFVRSAEALATGAKVTLEFARGEADATVTAIRKGGDDGTRQERSRKQ